MGQLDGNWVKKLGGKIGWKIKWTNLVEKLGGKFRWENKVNKLGGKIGWKNLVEKNRWKIGCKIGRTFCVGKKCTVYSVWYTVE